MCQPYLSGGFEKLKSGVADGADGQLVSAEGQQNKKTTERNLP